jgi:chromosomal replication initiation ATPase DnaA
MVEARDAFYYLSRHLTPRTYVEIGRFLADRDHSTVLTGVGRASMRLPAHKRRLVKVCKQLNIKINIEGL